MDQNDAPQHRRSRRKARLPRRPQPDAILQRDAPAKDAIERFRRLLADLIAKRILADRHATSPVDQP
jgi:hypothetical protein